MATLTDRQHQLYEWLQNQHHLSIDEIKERLGISAATAYRDTHTLIQAGLAEKTNRGIKTSSPVEPVRQQGKCGFCGGPINERAFFVIQMQDGAQIRACCPHCGLMALNQTGVASALANDYLYGRMINARQAIFLLKSSVYICCEPSVLCFASEEDARRFQSGFGGEICTLDQAKTRVTEIMSLGAETPNEPR
jgi:DeoR family transcriptional regulator, copper-sensing transcriptional repressor